MHLRKREVVKKESKTAKKVKPQRKLPYRKTRPSTLTCPRTGEIIWIHQASLQDIKHAEKTGKQPYPANRKYLLTVSSQTTREQVYETAELALADYEINLLPTYGGRRWKVEVKITDPAKGKSPYFCFQKGGKLELACFPLLLNRIPKPPKFPVTPKDEDDEGEELPIDEYIYELQERKPTSLSQLAHDEKWRVPLPNVSVKWISPLREIYHTRKQAWERATELCRNETLITRVLEGIDASGRAMKLTPCGKTQALKAGTLKFERDGLWVVGQEDAWREGVVKERKETAPEAKGISPLAYYLQCNREEYKRKRLEELKSKASAENNPVVESNAELTDQTAAESPQKSLIDSNQSTVVSPSPVHNVVSWVSNIVKNFDGAKRDISKELAESKPAKPDEVIQGGLPIDTAATNDLNNTGKSGTGEEADPKSTKSKPSFTLRDAEKELRMKWKNLDEDEREKWKKLAREYSEEKDQEDVSPATEAASCDGDKVGRVTPPNNLVLPASSTWRLSPKQIEMCYQAGMEHYDQVMRTVQTRDLDRELRDGFDVLRERGRGRFDMELPAFDSKEFSFLTDLKKTPWMPVVKQILGNNVVLIHKGMFLSMPGAETQVYHQDGTHLTDKYQKPCHAINVFVPLVDLELQNGPTHFCLGSQILGEEGYKKKFTVTPTASAGTPIIFDYRLGHYGLANNSTSCRPILYCTYAAAADGKEFRDSVNFSRKRYHRIGDLVSKAPSREERAIKRTKVHNDDV